MTELLHMRPCLPLVTASPANTNEGTTRGVNFLIVFSSTSKYLARYAMNNTGTRKEKAVWTENHNSMSAGVSLTIWRRYVRLQMQPKSTRKPPTLDPGILYLSQTNMAMTNATPADINKIKLKVTSITRSPWTRSLPPPALKVQ